MNSPFKKNHTNYFPKHPVSWFSRYSCNNHIINFFWFLYYVFMCVCVCVYVCVCMYLWNATFFDWTDLHFTVQISICTKVHFILDLVEYFQNLMFNLYLSQIKQEAAGLVLTRNWRNLFDRYQKILGRGGRGKDNS